FLVLGLWTRAAGLLSTAMYVLFTAATLSVIARDMPVDCGCFGPLFGSGPIGWNSIVRNTILLLGALLPTILGGGRFALDAVMAMRSRATDSSPDRGAEAATRGAEANS